MPKKSTKKTPTANLQKLKVAIVHDWLYGGGAELVVEQLHKMFPEAPIYASWATDEWRKRLDDKVITGFLQHQPFRKLYKYMGVLRIFWYTRLKFDDYDLVISSSGAEAKGINVPAGVVHVNYCHAPTHYYWSRYDEYTNNPGFGIFNPLARIGLRLLVRPLRRWDYNAAQKPHFMLANSTHIKQEVEKYYGRKVEVVHPPVEVEKFKPADWKHSRYSFTIIGRQTPYKRFDLAVGACSMLKAPLKVLGKGPEYHALTAMAGPSIRFLGYVSDEEKVRHLQSSEGFIFPGLDDFGIVPVEALAAGTPVIAYKGGGALDYIKQGVNGVFFQEQTVESLVAALKSFDPSKYDPKKISKSAEKFSAKKFQSKMTKTLLKYISTK